MAVEASIGFRSVQETQDLFLQASATNLGGFLINQNYDTEIEDYRRMITKFWQMIPQGNKKPARSPIVQKIKKDKRAKVGFVDRGDLSGAIPNTKTDLERNLNDPGQEVKAISATLDFSHFARSMAAQQGRPYGDEIAEDTDDMMKEAYRFLEMQLFRADASVDPLEFNGLQAQGLPDDHVFNVDLTAASPESIWEKINEVTMRATTDREILRSITHIWMTGGAYVQVQKETKNTEMKLNQTEIIPGVRVPAIMTGDGEKPLISTPYLDDLPGVDGGDILRIYLLDMNAIEWHGVKPDGGISTFEPQIFDVTGYLNGEFLVLKRLLLMYGTPYVKNNSLYRIDVKAPLGSSWHYRTP